MRLQYAVTASTRAFRGCLGAAAIAIAAGCDGFGAGPCEHTYRDPVLAITAATDSVSAGRIAPIFITDVSVSGRAQPLDLLLSVGFGSRLKSDTLVCDVPCGFGTSEGRYDFTASAAAYVPRTFTLHARFDRFEGGCPSYNAGSTRTSVALRRSPSPPMFQRR